MSLLPVAVVVAVVASAVSAVPFESQAVSERAAMHAVSKMFFISMSDFLNFIRFCSDKGKKKSLFLPVVP